MVVWIAERAVPSGGLIRELELHPSRCYQPLMAASVNKHRALISAIYGYGMRGSSFGLPANPASGADKRRGPHRGVLLFFTPVEIEALARTLEAGLHHDPSCPAVSTTER